MVWYGMVWKWYGVVAADGATKLDQSIFVKTQKVSVCGAKHYQLSIMLLSVMRAVSQALSSSEKGCFTFITFLCVALRM